MNDAKLKCPYCGKPIDLPPFDKFVSEVGAPEVTLHTFRCAMCDHSYTVWDFFDGHLDVTKLVYPTKNQIRWNSSITTGM